MERKRSAAQDARRMLPYHAWPIASRLPAVARLLADGAANFSVGNARAGVQVGGVRLLMSFIGSASAFICSASGKRRARSPPPHRLAKIEEFRR